MLSLEATRRPQHMLANNEHFVAVSSKAFATRCIGSNITSSRWFSAGSSTGGGMDQDLRKRMDALADLFVEAREEIELADESKGSTYFNEEAEAAQEAVDAALAEYANILGELEEPQKGEFQRSNGLKMEQLRAEMELLLEDDDH